MHIIIDLLQNMCCLVTKIFHKGEVQRQGGIQIQGQSYNINATNTISTVQVKNGTLLYIIMYIELISCDNNKLSTHIDVHTMGD